MKYNNIFLIHFSFLTHIHFDTYLDIGYFEEDKTNSILERIKYNKKLYDFNNNNIVSILSYQHCNQFKFNYTQDISAVAINTVT